MLQLLRYLKKFSGAALLVLALLAVQAACDLALPEYTSRIVDVGIQQGGVESAVPEVIRAETLADLVLFMDAEAAQAVSGSFEALEHSGYPTDAPLLALKADADAEALRRPFARAWTLASFLGGESEEYASMREQLTGSRGEMLSMIRMLPDAARKPLLERMNQMLEALPEAMVIQSGIARVTAEYEAIGVPSRQTSYIVRAGLRMMGIVLLAALATVSVSFLSSRIAAGLGRELRKRVFERVLSFGHAEMDRFSTASLITRTTNDIQQVQQMMVMLLRILIYAPIMAVGGVIKVLQTNTSMAWIIAVGVAAVLILIGTLFKVAMPRFKKLQTLIDRINLVAREALTGMQVIRAFSTQDHEKKRFEKANQDLTGTALFVNRAMVLMMPAMMLIMNGLAVLIIWNGAYGIDSGTLQVGEMMAFIQYAMQIIMSFLMISMLSIMLPRALVALGRVQEVLHCEPALHDPAQPLAFPVQAHGVVRFEDVSFQYPGSEEPVLQHISFEAKPGQTTAFIGSTGSGKSTLVNLVPRFYDVSSGKVTIDGVDVRAVGQQALRARIGYVPQKGVLFSGDIASNIAFGEREIDDADIRAAAETAQAADFIEEKPQQYQDPIAQGGGNVSGGQKQRLSIARALAGKPDILIFDDSFSALDFRTDASLRAALKQHTGQATVLLVAQRVSTLMNAEQIIVLDQGRIVGIGTHRELLETCPVYRDIAQTQLSREELEA